jgi:hypothetical protein
LFVVASRPGACDITLLRELGFFQANMDELSEAQRNAFIDNWHQAYASKHDRSPADRETARVAEALKILLANQPRLGRLATNPLLCAAICALHERDRDALPRSEWDLCDKLTRMLAEQRDRSAGRQGSVGLDQFGPAYRLDYAVRRNILSRLADAMTSQQLSALPVDEAREHVAETLSRSRSAEGLRPQEVLDALVARSGVLRLSSVLAAPQFGARTRDAVEFAHNTLKAWLASLHCLQQNKPRALASDSLVSGMDQVVVFAAGAPMHQAYAERLIESLLAAAAGAEDPAQRRAIEMIALRCDAVAPELSPALHRRLAALADAYFPPSTFQEARALAALGDAAVARLEPAAVGAAAVPALRCLRLVGTEAARRVMEQYRDTRDPEALEELAQVIDPLLLPAVLEAVQNYQRFLSLRPSVRERIQILEALSGLKTTRNLWLSGTSISNLSPLGGLRELRSLDVSHTRVADVAALVSLPKLTSISLLDTRASLAPLAEIASLRQLSVGGDPLTSLAPVSQLSQLGILIVLYSPIADLEPLASLVSLKDLTIIQSQVTDLSPLAELAALTNLDLGSSPATDLSPIARMRSLKSLRLSNLPVDRLNALSPLTSLTSLAVPNLPVDDLTPLAGMNQLERLDISGTRVKTLQPIIALPNLRSVLAHKSQLNEEEVKRFTSAKPGRKIEQGR